MQQPKVFFFIYTYFFKVLTFTLQLILEQTIHLIFDLRNKLLLFLFFLILFLGLLVSVCLQFVHEKDIVLSFFLFKILLSFKLIIKWVFYCHLLELLFAVIFHHVQVMLVNIIHCDFVPNVLLFGLVFTHSLRVIHSAVILGESITGHHWVCHVRVAELHVWWIVNHILSSALHLWHGLLEVRHCHVPRVALVSKGLFHSGVSEVGLQGLWSKWCLIIVIRKCLV